jgi:broad specificity phosphatase PhoE
VSPTIDRRLGQHNEEETTTDTMLKIIVVRPGATDYVDQGRIQGNLDVPLNEHGKSEVARLTKELADREIEAIYCSMCQSAQATAKAIAETLDVKLKELRDMENLNQGLWQGMCIDEVKQRQPTIYRQFQDQPESVRPPQGETLGEATERVDRILEKLLKRHREGVIALVIPEPLASLVKARLCQGKVGDLWQASACHGDWQVLEISPEKVS